MQGGHPIGRARAALRALHRAQRSGDLESDLESNVAQSGNLEVIWIPDRSNDAQPHHFPLNRVFWCSVSVGNARSQAKNTSFHSLDWLIASNTMQDSFGEPLQGIWGLLCRITC